MKEIYKFYGLNKLVNETYKEFPNSIRIGKKKNSFTILIIWIISDYLLYISHMKIKNWLLLICIFLIWFAVIGRMEEWGIIEYYLNRDTVDLVTYKGDKKTSIEVNDRLLLMTTVLLKYSIICLWYYSRIPYMIMDISEILGIILEVILGYFPGIFILADIVGVCFSQFIFGKTHKILINNLKEIEVYNTELYYLKEKREKYNLLKIIENSESIKYMENAIRYFYEGEYEDSLSNVRHSLEVYLSEKMENDNIFYIKEKDITIYSMINYLKSKEEYDDIVDCLQSIRCTCNLGVHVIENDLYDKEWWKNKTEEVINKMLDILSSEYQIFVFNLERFKKIEEKIDVYLKRSEELFKRNEKADGLLNTRRALECLVNGYMHYFHLICTYGYQNDLAGYIDVLFNKAYITDKTKNNLHYIRKLGNESAHGNCVSIKNEQINSVLKKMRLEVEIYKKAVLQPNESGYEAWDLESEEKYNYTSDEEEYWYDETYQDNRDDYYECFNESDEEEEDNFYDQFDEEYHTPYELAHPEAYWDMDRFNDPSRLFDVENYFGP